jgi:hypothetical protein
MSDDTELVRAFDGCDDEQWRALIENWAHQVKLHYTMPDVRGMAPPGSFRIPRDVIDKLGDGDLQAGAAVAGHMFAVDDNDDPTTIHPHVVRILGEGNLTAGRRVLEKFVARVRRQSREDSIPQPDGHSPDRIIR